MMYLTTCVLLCCLVGIAQAKSSNVGYQGADRASDNAAYHGADGSSGNLFGTLIARIDQLEEKIEARDRLHQAEIDKLRHNCQVDTARQTARIDELEATVRKQNDKIQELVNTHDDTISKQRDEDANLSLTKPNEAVTFKEETVRSQRKSATEQRNTPVKSRNRIRRNENEIDVAFYATLSSNLQHMGTNQIIAFEHIVANIGNSYNPHSGVFVAPVAGTYVFSATLTTYVRQVAHYGLFMNLVKITSFYINGAENAYDTASQTAVLYLAKGDDVTIKHLDSDHGLLGDAYSMFSGFLLSQNFTDPSSAIVGK